MTLYEMEVTVRSPTTGGAALHYVASLSLPTDNDGAATAEMRRQWFRQLYIDMFEEFAKKLFGAPEHPYAEARRMAGLAVGVTHIYYPSSGFALTWCMKRAEDLKPEDRLAPVDGPYVDCQDCKEAIKRLS